MLLNVLVLAFVGCFIAVVMLGHVLLLAAVWPGLFESRHASRRDTVAEASRRLHQPN